MKYAEILRIMALWRQQTSIALSTTACCVVLLALGCNGVVGTVGAGSSGSSGVGSGAGSDVTSGVAGTGSTSGTSGTGGSGGSGNPPPPPPPVSGTIAGIAKQCADEPLRTTGTIHYVCDCGAGADANCVAGVDTGPGTTPAMPWRTYQKARATFPTIAAGDTIAFCKGGSFAAPAGEAWVNANCRAANPCIVRDYTPPWASGDETAPKLISPSGTLLGLDNPASAAHEEGYRFLNLELDGSDPQSTGVFVYNDVTDVTLCNVTLNGFRLGINIQGSNPPGPGSDGRNARFTLRGSRVTNITDIGWLGSCNDCVVEYNLFDNNGSIGDPTNHAIYFSGASDGNSTYTATKMRASGNEIYHSVQRNGACVGNPLVAHGQHDGLIVEGNTLMQDIGAATVGCWGISLDPGGYAGPEFFKNATVRNNRVINMGNVSIGVTSCSNCVIENNLIIQGQSFGGAAISAPDKDRDVAKGDGPLDAVTIRNNVVYYAATGGGTGIRLGTEGTGHVVASNAILSAGSNSTCFALGLASTAYYSDHNLCWVGSPGHWESRYAALTAWQATGLDLHSLNQDPMFVKAAIAGYDFTAAAGSPLIGAGDPAHSAISDILGTPRSTPPDIGAFQH
jgi:hypothetical protein